MKKLLFILCLVFNQPCFCQENPGVDVLTMDGEIVDYYEDFIEDAESRGYKMRALIVSKIDYMLFHPDLGTRKDDYRIGQVGKDNRGFFLSPRLKENPLKLRLVIYHEIGHVLKDSGKHSCDRCYDIMSSISPENLKPFMDEEFWNEKLDEYFKWLNSK